jgi:hypothetical protein
MGNSRRSLFEEKQPGDAALVCGWMNASRKQPNRTRGFATAEGLLLILQSYDSQMRPLLAEGNARGVSTLMCVVQEIIWKLQFNATFAPFESGWICHYSVVGADAEKRLNDGSTAKEGEVMGACLRLFTSGEISRVRMCEQCKEVWLFAFHSNYRFCSEKCRESFFQNTDAYRSRKASQMKRYRQRLQARDRENLRIVKQKLKAGKKNRTIN